MDELQAPSRLDRRIIPATAIAVVLIFSPVVIAGAPLADDFNNCLAPIDRGVGNFLGSSWERLEMVRLARFPEILVTTGVCRDLHFGVAIAVPLLLTLAVAFALAGLLRDLGFASPGPELAGALWLLQPLGTESALWPAALHVPLGLLLACLALRLYRGGRYALAIAATVGACLSVEQVLLVLPFAVWITGTRAERRRATALCTGTVLVVILSFLVWHGTDPRLQASFAERIAAAWSEPQFFILFAAVGLGVHSIPLAVGWAFPVSLVALPLGAVTAAFVGPRLAKTRPDPQQRQPRITLASIALLVLLINIPVVLAVQQQGSPRIFAPTWLVAASTVGVVLSSERWRMNRMVWAIAGLFVAGAILSLMLSVSVRLHSASFVEYATHQIQEALPSGGDAAMCGVRRTVVEPAPRGAFSIHEFVYEWAAQDAMRYYTDTRVNFDISGELWNRVCPGASRVDARFEFDPLVTDWARK